jgi:TolB-like protein/cytochrome c-type biogenesis protein CcmH/NrfG
VISEQEALADRLESWKQIAGYLHRSVRTVRRWEREEGLPVHRHVHRVLGSVYAHKSEIDKWRQTHRDPASRSMPATAVAGKEELQSIAVLPFTNLSADPENAYFADGLTDEITAGLSSVRSLRVISRTSAATFKESIKDAKKISRELGARYLLEGSVRRAGNQLRITAQLIDAEADAHLWAETFDGNIDDVFAIQERISRVIVSALQLRLSTEEDRRLRTRPIDNIHAYECYLRARQQGWRWRKDAIDQAIQLLRNGLAIVGDNARLYAALGIAYLHYREAGIDFGESPIAEAEACARKVVQLEGESAAALQLRGWIYYSRADIQSAVRELRLALDLEPNDADTLLLLSNCYLISGRPDAARALTDRLIALDPLTPLTRCMPAFVSIVEGDFRAAIEPYRQMFEMDPGNPMTRLFYIWVLVLNGRTDLVPGIVQSFPEEVRETAPARIAMFLGDTANDNSSAVSLPSFPREMEESIAATDVLARMLASAYARAGAIQHAIDWIARAVQRGFINYPFLSLIDPTLYNLRNEPQFKKLMEVVRHRWERFDA